MTKERKIYAVVLAVALLALAVNFLLPGGGATGPQAASASSQMPHPAAAVDAAKVADVVKKMNEAAATLDDNHTLAHQLSAFAEQRGYDLPHVHDAFIPDPSWAPAQEKKQAKPAPVVEAEHFRATHKLTGVMVSGGGGVAMVDVIGKASAGAGGRKAITVGQTIDGFELTAVRDGEATFRRGKAELTLQLELPQTESGAVGPPRPLHRPAPPPPPPPGAVGPWAPPGRGDSSPPPRRAP